jgi:alpha/beta superfamily hydrolase
LATIPMELFSAGQDERPVHILQPAHDQFNPPDQLMATVEGWIATTVEIIDNTDHFLHGIHQQVTLRAAELACS